MVTTRSQQSKERSPAANEQQQQDEIPEHIRNVKEKLERETGKKYRYQPAKKDMPSVGDLLKHGAPGAKPPTFRQSLKSAVMLATLFGLSLFVFHHAVLKRPSKRKPYKLPYQKRAEAAARKREQGAADRVVFDDVNTAENAVPVEKTGASSPAAEETAPEEEEKEATVEL